MRALLSPEQERLYDDLANADGVVRLRDVAVPRIGVVTGNNGFFVMSPDERDRREIPAEWFKPVVRKLAQLPGLIATDDDIDSHLSGETRSLLLTIAKGDHVPSPLQTYLDEGEQNGVDGAHKCQIRDPWYSHRDAPRVHALHVRILAADRGESVPSDVHQQHHPARLARSGAAPFSLWPRADERRGPVAALGTGDALISEPTQCRTSRPELRRGDSQGGARRDVEAPSPPPS